MKTRARKRISRYEDTHPSHTTHTEFEVDEDYETLKKRNLELETKLVDLHVELANETKVKERLRDLLSRAAGNNLLYACRECGHFHPNGLIYDLRRLLEGEE